MSEAGPLRPEDLTPGPVTPGMTRMQAYATDDRWIGHVRSEPGVLSGWHHHAGHDTYFYVLAGGCHIDLEGGRTFEVHTGDFAHIPPGTVHREGPIGDTALEAIVIRFGTGPQSVDVPEPAA